MRNIHRSLRKGVVVLVLCGSFATAGWSATATAATSDPFAGVPSPKLVTKFVGTANAIPLGIHVGADGSAVAYWCDGTGKVSTWFTGAAAPGATTLSLIGAGGATLRFDLAKHTGTLKVGAASSTFTLEPARGIAGVYRQTSTSTDGPVVAGWVVTNPGRLSGQIAVNGVSFQAGADDLSKKLVTSSAVPSSSVPPGAQVMSLRCSIIDFRIGFNRSQEGDARNTAAANDARDDIARLLEHRAAAGC